MRFSAPEPVRGLHSAPRPKHAAEPPNQQPMSDVVHDSAAHRLRIDLPEGEASLEYQERDGRMVLLHTGVPEDAEGEGYGGALVRAAFDHARATGVGVVPLCAFARAYVARHPEYADLVADAA